MFQDLDKDDPEIKDFSSHYNCRIHWDVFWCNLSANENAMYILENYLNNINWDCLSQNKYAMNLLKQYPKNIHWGNLAKNENASDLLKDHFKKKNDELNENEITNLAQNKSKFAMDYIEKHLEKYKSFTRLSSLISKNESTHAVDFLKMHPTMINWETISSNKHAMDIIEPNLNKINWANLSKNENAVSILKNNQDKINWHNLSFNKNAMDLLIENKKKINWKNVATNENAVDLLKKHPKKINWENLAKNESDDAIYLLTDAIPFLLLINPHSSSPSPPSPPSPPSSFSFSHSSSSFSPSSSSFSPSLPPNPFPKEVIVSINTHGLYTLNKQEQKKDEIEDFVYSPPNDDYKIIYISSVPVGIVNYRCTSTSIKTNVLLKNMFLDYLEKKKNKDELFDFVNHLKKYDFEIITKKLKKQYKEEVKEFKKIKKNADKTKIDECETNLNDLKNYIRHFDQSYGFQVFEKNDVVLNKIYITNIKDKSSNDWNITILNMPEPSNGLFEMLEITENPPSHLKLSLKQIVEFLNKQGVEKIYIYDFSCGDVRGVSTPRHVRRLRRSSKKVHHTTKKTKHHMQQQPKKQTKRTKRLDFIL